MLNKTIKIICVFIDFIDELQFSHIHKASKAVKCSGRFYEIFRDIKFPLIKIKEIES